MCNIYCKFLHCIIIVKHDTVITLNCRVRVSFFRSFVRSFVYISFFFFLCIYSPSIIHSLWFAVDQIGFTYFFTLFCRFFLSKCSSNNVNWKQKYTCTLEFGLCFMTISHIRLVVWSKLTCTHNNIIPILSLSLSLRYTNRMKHTY